MKSFFVHYEDKPAINLRKILSICVLPMMNASGFKICFCHATERSIEWGFESDQECRTVYNKILTRFGQKICNDKTPKIKKEKKNGDVKKPETPGN